MSKNVSLRKCKLQRLFQRKTRNNLILVSFEYALAYNSTTDYFSIPPIPLIPQEFPALVRSLLLRGRIFCGSLSLRLFRFRKVRSDFFLDLLVLCSKIHFYRELAKSNLLNRATILIVLLNIAGQLLDTR